jgi:YidC/Oxa1 family membrane protein insertase
MDTKRLILFVIFSFSIMMLWEAWQRDHVPQVQQADRQAVQSGDVGVPQPVSAQPVAVHEVGFSMQQGERIHVRTDLYQVEIDTTGGDIRQLELLKHRDSKDIGKYFTLFDDHALPAVYVAQSGLIGNGLPSHKVVFSTKADSFSMQNGHDALEVRLSWDNGKGVQVDKIYTFHRGSYVTDLTYEIHNGGSSPLDPSVYYQIVHDSVSDQGTKMMPTFTGAAYFTDAEKFKKISFSAMEKNNLSLNSNDGWIGLVQHYFVSAWIPKVGMAREYYTRHLSDNVYSMGVVSALGSIAPGATFSTTARLYAGPQEQSQLLAAAPGMKYTVDYGWLTIIATPLFWVLSNIENLVQNWGVAIILLTVLLKLAFYPLSAASYRSMAHMRELAPRLQQLKEKFGDDRQKLHQAMMELYKTEKINPMGGCLPIVVQIPVFISLYWVLLGNVEMRHAPFALWIHDLSASDPYYVLPIIMGITMIIQSRLNPTPPDPIQAKVMMFMPVVFSVFFFFFPAGLVLYWVVNNILSITQQWYINRTIALAAKSKKGHAHS